MHIEPLECRRLLSADGTLTRFAVIGDYGWASQEEEDVANLVKSWNPDHVITVGDNNYEFGSAETIDANIGQYYHQFIHIYQGTYGPGSPTQRFWPSLGNHDWLTAGAQPYLDYFDLPGNERYYEFAIDGVARFFAIDSDPNEPHGVTANSIQGQWLQSRLAAATEPHRIVYFHHPPYSSGRHGSQTFMQWPFKQWGATVVLAGHSHHYERLTVDDLSYFINGLGGRSIREINDPVPGSELRFNGDFGAQLAEMDASMLRLKFYTRANELIDTHTINATGPQPAKITVAATDPVGSENGDPIVFTFTRSVNTAGPLTVHFTLGGTATSGIDYTAPAAVHFEDGASAATLTIVPIDDTLYEGTETIELTLAPHDDYNRGAIISASATITDNDAVEATLVPQGAVWKYLDNGSNQGTAWRNSAFHDTAWAAGPAKLGYGEGDEATVINGGPPGNRFITTYFRHAFEVVDPGQVVQLEARLLRDDGAVIYINGTEVWRDNMPSGTITYQTHASSVVGGADESTFFSRLISASALVGGTNIIAVELHQSGPQSSDAGFDLSLEALLDIFAPAAPSRPDLGASSDSGIFDDDDITNVTTPTFTGTAEPGSTVRLFADGVMVGSAVAADGNWSITASPLAEGLRLITATATDIAGNVSAPSSSLAVLIDTTGPALVFGDFEFNAAPMRVAFGFDEPVDLTLDLDDVVLRNLTTNGTVDPTMLSLTFGSATIWMHFPGFLRGILPDGDYRATFTAAGITDVAGNPMPQDGVIEFFFMQADANRDRQVNLADLNILAGNFGQAGRTFSQGDFNYDGVVNLLDFNILAGRFGGVLARALASGHAPADARLDRDPWTDELLGAGPIA